MPRHLPVSARSGRSGRESRVEGETSRRSRQEPARPTIEDSGSGRTLSAADAAFLYLERKEMPLAIACVMIFDGPIAFDEFVSSIAAKLHRVPRYRQVVVMPPLNIGMPTWEDDPHFDIRRHIFRVALKPPGGEAELEALVGGIFSQMLDRSKPLWEIHVVHGLKDGRGAPDLAVAPCAGRRRIPERDCWSYCWTRRRRAPLALRKPCPPPPQPSNGAPAAGISGVVQTTLDRLIATESGLLGFAQALLGDPQQEGSEEPFGSTASGITAGIRGKASVQQAVRGSAGKFCWAEFDMAEIKTIREALGGRVNDVILTMLTRALALYVKLHGQSIMNRFVRIVCPVNLRQPGQEESLGNRISFMPVALPMDVRDPGEMLRAVAARTEAMKRSGAAALVGVMAGCIAKAPTALQALFWWGLPELILPVPLLNLICTNVPGPPIPLYAAGRRMIAVYPQVPTGYDLGVNVAVESYDGKLFFGLIADAQAASDMNRLRDFLYVSFQELGAAARKQAAAATKQSRKRRKDVIRAGRSARKQRSKTAEAISPVIAEIATGSVLRRC